MIEAVRKIRDYTDSCRGSARPPNIFLPPVGGTGYFGRSYRWQQVLHYKYWSFVAIRIWVKHIAGGDPIKLGEVHPKSGKAVRKSLGGPRPHEEFVAWDDDHPLVRLFRNPNGPDVAYDHWAFHTLFKKLTGSSHWWLVGRNRFGVPSQMWVIPTHWMQLVTGHHGLPSHYYVQSPWGPGCDVPYDDVVSFYEHSPLNRYEGWAVNQATNEWIDVYEALTRTWLATFKNGAVPSFHVQLGDAYGDPDEAMMGRFYAKWFQRFQGENRASRPLITGSDVEVKQIGVAPTDIGFEVGEERIRDNTLAAFEVPKAVALAQDTTTYGAVRAVLQWFFESAVNPELVYQSQVITEKIVKPIVPNGVAFWDDRVSESAEEREQRLAARVADGRMTHNEARAECGMEAYPHGGDNPMVNGVELPWVTGDMGQALQSAFLAAAGKDVDAASAAEESDALNGAQIASLVVITDAVSEGRLTTDSARAIITAAFPSISPSTVDAIVDSLRPGGEINAAVRRAPRDNYDIEQAFRRRLALGSSSGASGGYLNGAAEPKRDR